MCVCNFDRWAQCFCKLFQRVFWHLDWYKTMNQLISLHHHPFGPHIHSLNSWWNSHARRAEFPPVKVAEVITHRVLINTYRKHILISFFVNSFSVLFACILKYNTDKNSFISVQKKLRAVHWRVFSIFSNAISNVP